MTNMRYGVDLFSKTVAFDLELVLNISYCYAY